MNQALVTVIGLLASFLTTASFLPQAFYVIRTKDTKSLSLPMYIMFVVGVMSWCIYGLFLRDFPLIFANVVTGIFAGIILFYKIREKKSG
ncbi:MAG: SemiSWEET transporter [Streptococcaceae bacterium]|jgi:MtN3 and saliva related transmembrane protein|nr:SemiSWEET transporter [Streptococcaceae bacterium]